MTVKALVMETVRKMPEAATFEEITEEIALLAALRRAEAEADQGKLISHEEVESRVPTWIKNAK